MLVHTTALALALAPDPTIPPISFDVADVEVVARDNSTHLLAYDADGEVAAEIVVTTEADDRTRLDVMFPDGLYLTAVAEGESITVETDDAAEVAARVAIVEESLASITDVDVMKCAGSVIVAVGGCGWGGPLACMGAVAFAGINCGPLIAEVAE
jgi:hypothetical protein